MLQDLWTLWPYAKHAVVPVRTPAAREWAATLVDPRIGPVRITGKLRDKPGARVLAIVCHGLGGSTESYYVQRAVSRLDAFGLSSLCLALRGADRQGEDFYNIALVADLEAAVASPELARYECILVFGYSMGGYVALHFARDPKDPRVRAVAAVCTPIDLSAAQVYVDSPRAWIYRHHVLQGLIEIYEQVARRRAVPADVALVRRVKTIYEWDRLTIAPRYGFTGPEDYYEKLSIRPHVGDLAVPALLVAGERDPIIPPATIRPFLGAAERPTRRALEVRWVVRGGHVAFPSDLDLGFGPELGLDAQIVQWALARC
jgi:predicted alpha/beta-fold hydrolase